MESNLSLGFVRYVSWSRTLVESQRCTSMRTVLPNHDTLPVVPLESTAILLHYFFFPQHVFTCTMSVINLVIVT